MSYVHRDDTGSKMAMWLFIFTEILLFGGLFITYVVYRYLHKEAFHLAGQELDVTLGTINTIILLISSATIAMSITAIQQKKKKLSLWLIASTLILATIFIINKYFEWGAKFDHGIFPGSEYLEQLGYGDILFFGLYFFMTGLHLFHIVVGMVVLGFMFYYVKNDSLTHDNFQLLENGGLYWHLVDLIWIFLFPLFYLIA
jgi:cytochrome c oxidase subunit 3